MRCVALTPPNVTLVAPVRLSPAIATLVPTGPAVGEKLEIYGVTRKLTLLVDVPLGVVTLTLPVVAPLGTVVLISVLETTVNVAARAVESDAGRARQIVSQDDDGRSHLAGGGLCFHERAQPHRQAEDRATASRSAPPAGGCPVEVPVGGLHQPVVRDVAVGGRRSCAAWSACPRR